MTIKMDAQLRAMLTSEMGDILRGIAEGNEERWVNAEGLTSQFNFFTKSWLKSYGHLLPRQQVVVSSPDGEHRTGWCYPIHKIQRMIQNGEIKKLRL